MIMAVEIKNSGFLKDSVKQIPDFKTLEESAEYWDTHSFADHIDDTKPVEIEVRIEGHELILDIDRTFRQTDGNCQEEKAEL